jgi:LasA protease
MVACRKMRLSASVKRYLVVILVLTLTGCNLPLRSQPAFVPPSGLGGPPTATPDWYATVQAAAPATASPDPPVGTDDPPPEATAEEATPFPIEVSDPTETPFNSVPILYYTQAGDTLSAVAVRFGVSPDEITSPEEIPPESFINPNQLLIIPNRISNATSSVHLLPDSELVYSSSAISFDVGDYVMEAGGHLSTYKEYLGSTGVTSGADIVAMIALDNSINPRLLLALLEFQSGWVFGEPANLAQTEYPYGMVDRNSKGLLRQLKWAVNQLSIGYYDWREGRLNEIKLSDGVTARLAPDLNAGTAALQYYFAQIYDSQAWVEVLDPETGFPAHYERMFGSPWLRAQVVEPLFPPNLVQPHLELPFLIGPLWSYTGGPHGAWERDGSWAAVDFAPASTQSGCVESGAWVAASAAGLVVRSERGIVVLDLDGDGNEQTGWVLVYLHIASKMRIDLGEWVETGDLLGHPSCEGGHSTGTHVHMARKFNGEWMTADGPVPFVLSGWRVHAGEEPYKGTLTRGDETVVASQVGAFTSRIKREGSSQ